MRMRSDGMQAVQKSGEDWQEMKGEKAQNN